jgi:hypothetical protein
MSHQQHQEQAQEARLRLRGLLRVLYAADEQLRIAERTAILSGDTPPITPERLSALLAAVDDATYALDSQRRRLRQGGLHDSADLGPLPPEPIRTAAELRQEVQQHGLGTTLHFLADCLGAVDFTTEEVQAAALPGMSFDLLAADILTALRLLMMSHMDLGDGLKQANRAYWKRHGPPPPLPS